MGSPIHGGRRRRRVGGGLVALLLLVAAPLAVAGAAYFAFVKDDGNARPRAPLAARHAPNTRTPVVPGRQRPPTVRLEGVDAFNLRMKKPPRAALVFDVDTGEVLWRHRALGRAPIASLTKVMTALLVTSRTGPEDRVRITDAALRYEGSGIGILPRGKRVRLETLLNGLLLVSGNDAAIALAVHVAGSEQRFVGLMNRRARQLGLRCTRFWDSHGLSPRNVSCPRDLAVLTRLAMRDRRIARIVRRRQVTFRFPVKGGKLVLAGHNPLFRTGYRGARGLKTGYTEAAGRCLVGVARRGGRTLGVVLLDSANPYRHAPSLLDAGFRAVGRG